MHEGILGSWQLCRGEWEKGLYGGQGVREGEGKGKRREKDQSLLAEGDGLGASKMRSNIKGEREGEKVRMIKQTTMEVHRPLYREGVSYSFRQARISAPDQYRPETDTRVSYNS